MARRVNAAMAAADAQAIAELRIELSLNNYASMLVSGRGGVPRAVQIFLGPPNSGKTYEALRELEVAPSGSYLAPLRLLALEVRDVLAENGVACDLVTRTATTSTRRCTLRALSSVSTQETPWTLSLLTRRRCFSTARAVGRGQMPSSQRRAGASS